MLRLLCTNPTWEEVREHSQGQKKEHTQEAVLVDISLFGEGRKQLYTEWPVGYVIDCGKNSKGVSFVYVGASEARGRNIIRSYRKYRKARLGCFSIK